MFCRSLLPGWCIFDIELFPGEHIPDMTQKGRCVSFRPEIHIQRVDLVQIFLPFIPFTVAWKMPLIMSLHLVPIDRDGEETGMFVRVLHARYSI